MELSVVRSGGSLRLLIPKSLASELGWKPGDVLEFAVRGRIIEIRSLGRGRLSGIPFRRRLGRFGGSLAVTVPREVRSCFTGRVRVKVERGRLIVRVIE